MVKWSTGIGIGIGITIALRYLYCTYFSPQSQTTDDDDQDHGVSSSTVGVSALARHLYNYVTTSQVPEGLSKHVKSSKKTQSNWYDKLSKAWRESKRPPKTPEEASRLIVHILQRHQRPDVEGLLSFYGLPFPHSLVELPTGEAPPLAQGPKFELNTLPVKAPPLAERLQGPKFELNTLPVKASPLAEGPKFELNTLPVKASPLAEGPKFELNTLPVDARAVPDGDGITVYVSTSDARESSRVPQEIQRAVVKRDEARAERNYTKADALHKQITDAGYRVIRNNNVEILARKYRIRLRGIDAPENGMPYGKEAKDELVKIISGECLKILIFGKDKYGRLVGDVYCNGILVQEIMLKKGLAWHYTFHDNRPRLAKWEKYARARKIGLWASPNPEMPWDWRKNHREQIY